FLGLKGGGYTRISALSTNTGGNSRTPVSVVLGDVNNDTKLDMVVASSQDNNVAIFLGNGDGTFQNPTHLSVGRTPTQVVLSDVNKDGDLDILVAHNGGGGGGGGGGSSRGVSLRLGNGNGTFQNTQEVFGGFGGGGSQPH